MQNLYKPLSILAVLLLILSFFLTIRYGSIVQEDIADSVLRLHILANSDSEEDQAQKLRLRDAILENCRQYFENCTSPRESFLAAQNHIADIQKAAEDFLIHENTPPVVSVTVGESEFPTKAYGGFTLPAGTYNALKIVIGEGKGHNWWCVMYPSLCLLDGVVTAPDSAAKTLKESLSPEEYAVITGNEEPGIRLKFKIVELIGRWSK